MLWQSHDSLGFSDKGSSRFRGNAKYYSGLVANLFGGHLILVLARKPNPEAQSTFPMSLTERELKCYPSPAKLTAPDLTQI